MNTELVEKVVREYIGIVPHLSLATVNDNKPWVCELHFAADDDLNLYFVSNPATRHCLEITENSNVAGNIIRQHLLTEAPSGIYFEGSAEKIDAPTDDEIEHYATTLGRDIVQVTQQLQGDRCMYKISVTNWAVFGNFDDSGHKKSELKWGLK